MICKFLHNVQYKQKMESLPGFLNTRKLDKGLKLDLWHSPILVFMCYYLFQNLKFVWPNLHEFLSKFGKYCTSSHCLISRYLLLYCEESSVPTIFLSLINFVWSSCQKMIILCVVSHSFVMLQDIDLLITSFPGTDWESYWSVEWKLKLHATEILNRAWNLNDRPFILFWFNTC
jgi:hypothetical protein